MCVRNPSYQLGFNNLESSDSPVADISAAKEIKEILFKCHPRWWCFQHIRSMLGILQQNNTIEGVYFLQYFVASSFSLTEVGLGEMQLEGCMEQP